MLCLQVSALLHIHSLPGQAHANELKSPKLACSSDLTWGRPTNLERNSLTAQHHRNLHNPLSPPSYTSSSRQVTGWNQPATEPETWDPARIPPRLWPPLECLQAGLCLLFLLSVLKPLSHLSPQTPPKEP